MFQQFFYFFSLTFQKEQHMKARAAIFFALIFVAIPTFAQTEFRLGKEVASGAFQVMRFNKTERLDTAYALNGLSTSISYLSIEKYSVVDTLTLLGPTDIIHSNDLPKFIWSAWKDGAAISPSAESVATYKPSKFFLFKEIKITREVATRIGKTIRVENFATTHEELSKGMCLWWTTFVLFLIFGYMRMYLEEYIPFLEDRWTCTFIPTALLVFGTCYLYSEIFSQTSSGPILFSAIIFWLLFYVGIKVQVYDDPTERFGVSMLAMVPASGTLLLVGAGFYSIVPAILIATGTYLNRSSIRG